MEAGCFAGAAAWLDFRALAVCSQLDRRREAGQANELRATTNKQVVCSFLQQPHAVHVSRALCEVSDFRFTATCHPERTAQTHPSHCKPSLAFCT